MRLMIINKIAIKSRIGSTFRKGKREPREKERKRQIRAELEIILLSVID